MVKVVKSFLFGALLLISNSSFAIDVYVCDKATLARIEAGDKELQRAMHAKFMTISDIRQKVLTQISLARADERASKLAAFIPNSGIKIEAYEELASMLFSEEISAFPCVKPTK